MNLETLIAHGLELGREQSTQFICDCPFCGKAKHFYIHKEKLGWDCKVCGLSGGAYEFLAHRAKGYAEGLDLKPLAENRGLPLEAIQGWGIGTLNGNWTIPYMTADTRACDIRLYRPAPKRILSTKGARPGLFNMAGLSEPGPVYICEGEFDTMALQYILDEGVAVGLPGASTFREEWVKFLAGRDIITCLDNDSAGVSGHDRIVRMMGSKALSVRRVTWPKDFPEGYDIRDLYIDAESPKTALEAVHHLTEDVTLSERLEAEIGAHVEPASFEDLLKVFKTWLYLPDESVQALKILLACMLSHRMRGDPLWLFLVGVPGDGKSEMLTAAAAFVGVHEISTLNATSLVSFYASDEDKDPSLLKRINEKIMAIKDFTAILTMRDDTRSEMMGILRDAYDGRVTRATGKSEKTIESRFSILAGVTPSIYESEHKLTSLGPRFIKVHMGSNLNHAFEKERITQGQQNIDHEPEMRKQLGEIMVRYLVHAPTPTMDAIDDTQRSKVAAMAQATERLRGSVSRDQRDPTQMLGKPSTAIGTRLGKQLTKLAVSLAAVSGTDTVTEADMVLVRKVARDTPLQTREDIIRAFCKGNTNIPDIMKATRYPSGTVMRILEDLESLRVVECTTGPRQARDYKLTAAMEGMIGESGLYLKPPKQPNSR